MSDGYSNFVLKELDLKFPKDKNNFQDKITLNQLTKTQRAQLKKFGDDCKSKWKAKTNDERAKFRTND